MAHFDLALAEKVLTLCADRGNGTYRITARRMISGEVLK